MKKDLLVASVLLVVTALGIAGVCWWLSFQPEDDGKKTLKPRTEPIAQLPKKKPSPPDELAVEVAPRVVPKKTDRPAIPEKKSEVVEKKIDEVPKIDPLQPEKKIVAKVEPKAELKVEPKKEEKKGKAKLVAIGNQMQFNDPEGEFTLPTINGSQTIILQGEIKTLKINGLNDRSTLDATNLTAHTVVFVGDVNSGSRVLLGKAQVLSIRDVNDRSVIDASALGAKEIRVHGAVNSNSTVKLHAPLGLVEFLGEINDRAQIDLVVPDGKVVLKGRGDSSINGDANLTIVTRDLDIRGAVHGTKTRINVSFTSNASLKFRRLTSGVNLVYQRARATDARVTIDLGDVDEGAILREILPKK